MENWGGKDNKRKKEKNDKDKESGRKVGDLRWWWWDSKIRGRDKKVGIKYHILF